MLMMMVYMMRMRISLTFLGWWVRGEGEGMLSLPIEVDRKALSLTWIYIIVTLIPGSY